MIPVDMSSWLNGFMGPTFQDRLGKPVLLRGYIQKQNCMMVICFSVVTVLTFIDHIPLFLRYFFHSIGHWLLTTSTWVTVVYAAKRGTGTWISWMHIDQGSQFATFNHFSLCFIPRNWMMIDSMSFRVADSRAQKVPLAIPRTRPNWRSSDYCLGFTEGMLDCFLPVHAPYYMFICLFKESEHGSIAFHSLGP